MQTTKASYDFTGRVVLITGAAGGIGKATATQFYSSGATVVIADVKEEDGNALVTQLGHNAFFINCDIADAGQVKTMIENVITRYGKIDIMINNAGINATAKKDRVSIDQYSEDTWQKIMQVDLNGSFYCCKTAAAEMVKQKSGVIINVASVAGVVALRLQSGFVAAKAALIKMTESMACELGAFGIRVNAVSPGSIMTETTKNLFYGENGSFSEMASRLLSFIPAGRPGEAEEIADAIVFLSSDSASYINGHNLVIDGGWTSGFNRDF